MIKNVLIKGVLSGVIFMATKTVKDEKTADVPAEGTF